MWNISLLEKKLPQKVLLGNIKSDSDWIHPIQGWVDSMPGITSATQAPTRGAGECHNKSGSDKPTHLGIIPTPFGC